MAPNNWKTVACGIAAGSMAVGLMLSVGGGVAGASGKVIKLGEISSLTGPVTGTFTGEPLGVQAYVDYVNAHGGVHGSKLELKEVDDGGTPSEDATEGKKFVDTTHVFAIVGGASVGLTGSIPFFNQENVPVVGDENVSGATRHPNMFAADTKPLLNTTPPTTSTDYGKFFKSIGGKKVAVVYISVNGAVNGTANSFAASARAVGLKSVGVDTIDPTGDNAATVASEVQSQGATLVVMDTGCNDSTALAEQFRRIGDTITMASFCGPEATAAQGMAGLSKAYSLSWTPWPYNSKVPGVKLFVKEFKKYEPGKTVTTEAQMGWGGTYELVTAIKHVGANRTKVEAYLSKLKTYTADGTLYPITYSTTGPPVMKCEGFVQDVSGNFTSFRQVCGKVVTFTY